MSKAPVYLFEEKKHMIKELENEINQLLDSIAGYKEKIKKLEEENEKLKNMINEIPCTCDEMYKSRNMCAPDCPRCNWIDESVVEKIKCKSIEEVLNETDKN